VLVATVYHSKRNEKAGAVSEQKYRARIACTAAPPHFAKELRTQQTAGSSCLN